MSDLEVKRPSPQSIHALVHGCPGENPLAPLYQDFQVHARALLTGHSHQAWPDCAKQGVLAAYQDAALHADDKWERALRKAERVRQGFAERLDDPTGAYVLGQNVHELFVRWCSALPAYQDQKTKSQPRPMLCSEGEFHSLRRQLDRWREYGLPLQTLPHTPKVATQFAEILASKPKAHFGAVILSAVGYLQGLWVPNLDQLAQIARDKETPLLIDAYHAINVTTFSVQTLDLHDAFIVGGGYKYCQLGEGACFLRIPQHLSARPGITGWFAEFELRDRVDPTSHQVHYPLGPAAFAGSTYDPTSHYRAAAVFDHFDRLDLTPKRLAAINQRQLTRLKEQLVALGLPPQRIALAHETKAPQRAGFLALRTPFAQTLSQALRAHQVYTDARHDILRLGPAPYLSDAQLDQGIEALQQCLATL